MNLFNLLFISKAALMEHKELGIKEYIPIDCGWILAKFAVEHACLKMKANRLEVELQKTKLERDYWKSLASED